MVQKKHFSTTKTLTRKEYQWRKILWDKVQQLLNLSTWKNKETSIANWLVEELSHMYGIPQWLGKAWVGNEQLILFLDGLDEVDIKCRSNCVKALNQFLQEYTSTNMVLCCRIQDYQALSEHLKFKSAIYLQPLTLKQIDEYLKQGGEK